MVWENGDRRGVSRSGEKGAYFGSLRKKKKIWCGKEKL